MLTAPGTPATYPKLWAQNNPEVETVLSPSLYIRRQETDSLYIQGHRPVRKQSMNPGSMAPGSVL